MNRGPVNLDDLRGRARQALAEITAPTAATPAADKTLGHDELLEELRIYQTELEIQNQNLANAQAQTEAAFDRYRTLFESLPLSGVLIDHHGFIVEANRQAREFLGLPLQAALHHRSAFVLFEPESRQRLHQMLRDGVAGAPQQVERMLARGEDGPAIPCDVHGIRLEPGPESAPGTLLVLVERKTEVALAESEGRYRALFDESPAPLLVYDPVSLGILAVNRRAAACYGRTAEELQTLTLLDLWPQEARAAATAALEQAVPGELPGDWQHCRRDGSQIDVVVSISALATGEGHRRMMLVEDISARRQAERRARELSLAVEQSTESIVITRTDGTIEYVNDAFLQVTGYRRDEVLGRNPRILQSGRTPRQIYDAMWASLAAGQPWRGEFINRRKDGSEYIEQAAISPLHQPDGSITHYVAVKADITEQKALQRQLEARMAELEVAREGAEAANRAKSAFLANMSHEIRTPLNAILGVAQLLEQMVADHPEQRELVAHIHSAGNVLLRSLNDVLDLAKIEAGELTIERAPFVLSEALSSVVHLMTPLARAKALTLRVEPGDCAGLRLVGDAVRLEQVLLNLVSNAVKFSSMGQVVLRVEMVGRAGSAVRLRFEVRDNGIGIAEAKLTTLFNPFMQADDTISRRFGGTGLGLSISKRLVEMMAGTIGARSVEGLGSTFWFELPLETQAPAEPGPAGSLARGGSVRPLSGLRVLVVDDSRMNLDVLRRILERDGAVAEMALDGKVCLEMLDAKPQGFDLVLMDIQMPVMDGLTATRLLREDPRFARLPVIALSAGVLPEERAKAFAAGIDDFLAKPINLPELRLVLARYLPPAPDPTP